MDQWHPSWKSMLFDIQSVSWYTFHSLKALVLKIAFRMLEGPFHYLLRLSGIAITSMTAFQVATYLAPYLGHRLLHIMLVVLQCCNNIVHHIYLTHFDWHRQRLCACKSVGVLGIVERHLIIVESKKISQKLKVKVVMFVYRAAWL